MKTRTLFVVGALLLCPFSVSAEVANQDISTFLENTYGILYKPSFFQRAGWECPSGRMTKPSGNVKRNWVCLRVDPSYRRQIAWRESDERVKLIEDDHFNAMAGGRNAERGDPSCSESPLAIDEGRIEARIRDCKLPLPNGEFYVSFLHFKHRDAFFTLSVRNASPTGSTPKVANDLREWVGEIKFAQ